MDTSEIIISLTLVLGFGYVLYLILQDPILLLKSLLRGLKNDANLKTLIIFFPIWGPIWLVDRAFGLKIYINDFEEASNPKRINFKEFDKYILVNTNDKEFIGNLIMTFQADYNPIEYSYNLGGSDIKMSDLENEIVIKIEREVRFDSFNALIQYMDNSAPQNQIYNVKGILLNRQNRAESYFVFFDTAFILKLVGKSYQNKRLYVDIDPEKGKDEIIYFNSNIDYFKNFNFDKFESIVMKLNFKDIEKRPSLSQQNTHKPGFQLC